MGKATGFLEYERMNRPDLPVSVRTQDFCEFHGQLEEDDRRRQGGRCMNCGVPFCQSEYGCPLHNLIPEWNDEVFGGNWPHALSRLLKTNNFPEFTGRVCPALCENACICGMDDQKSAVTVRDNELAIIETAWEKGLMEPVPPSVRTDKKIAIVGSGPAGLAAADQLNRRGHKVTVYEKDIRPGGLLMYGIPNMKLDKSIVERRIRKMEKEGIEFITGANVGTYIPGEQLIREYDAVLLCCGARRPRAVDNADEKVPGVYQAMTYLTENTKALLLSAEDRDRLENPTTVQAGMNGTGRLRSPGLHGSHAPVISARGKNVVIIGNGDTATDCVATAVRQGAKSITQLVRKPRPDDTERIWPYKSNREKKDYGQEEAEAVYGSDPRMYRSTVKELITDKNGRLSGIVVNQAGSEITIPADMLLLAAGFAGAEEKTASAFGLSLNEKGLLGSSLYTTSDPKVFAAGDMRRGATLVVTAIAEGRAAARAVDEYLEGYTNL